MHQGAAAAISDVAHPEIHIMQVLKAAQKIQKGNKEALLAIDHILMALAEEKALFGDGFNKDAFLQAVKDVKGVCMHAWVWC